ncbi:probable LRR receptor-like serine/threonine-protein kinase At1g53430 isoform X3 [Populus nigra]|uniref:probable LRR receptor-like serine/threonine-protein kinase At1g53430 isoform X3 n=1 Tax=Populus nigra TaxID=3691 RepID=UPI002B279285|nr:probable LRR receptor-like serine/threonine-protein kinase At1g53430 isoform X3 [Populus nigra]
MGVPFFLSVLLLLLLCQHGFGFRFRSTAVLGYGRGDGYPSEGRSCAYSRDRRCRDAVPYQRARNEFNCGADEGLPCEEVYALRAVISKLGLPKPSISRSYCSESDDNSISIQCDCDKTATNICHITSVVTFSMSLSGNIHERLCELTYLENIDFSNNQLHGTIPESLGNLTRLKTLNLGLNQLSGPIPPTLGKLVALETLDLHKNFLTESIPTSLGNFINLSTLSLENNMLSGPIPKELGNLLNLTTLRLEENQLSGYIPPELGNLSNLEELSLHSNNLTGRLPESFVDLTSLRLFNVAGNKLNGAIPPFIANLTNLYSLWVSDLNNSGFSFPEFANLTNIYNLILRNCSLTGGIPEYIGNNWTSLNYLDLSFNSLTGSIPRSLDLDRLLLTNNKLNGQIPPWIQDIDEVDLSYNNFTDFSIDNIPGPPHPNSTEVKIPGPGKPNITEPNRDSILALSKNCTSKYHSLFINCGGARTLAEGNQYDEDNATENFYSIPGKWAYSCAGGFISTTSSPSDYVKNMTCGVSVSEESLYKTARLCPVSLTYYGFCLHKGNYTVELHFAETVYTQDEDYSSLGTRIFDVYIQGERKLKDFNIKEKAKGTNEAWKKKFPAIVDDHPLEIHFFWAGKGSLFNPPALNGPLVSAISVTPNFDVHDRKLSASQIAGITIGCAFAPLLLFLFIWKMGFLGNRELREKQIEVQKRSFTLQQIIDGTKNFSSKMEIGRGRFGVVYKAELPYQIKLAVKKISPQSKQQDKDELKSEIGNLMSLSHENLVQLLGGYSNKDLHLLFYEYMESGSLHQALFEQKITNSETELHWRARYDICLGIAKGLKYLHEEEEKRIKIKIVHGNINAKNILLDKTHTAKLSDFGLATIYNEEDPFTTIKARGSRVYMAPEHALGKAITVKADVYSYGVVVLEIVSGRSNTEYIPNQEADFLLDTAGRLHQAGRIRDLVDKKLGSRFDNKQALTLLHLAMECINQSPTLRPSMSKVVTILSNPKDNALSSNSEVV